MSAVTKRLYLFLSVCITSLCIACPGAEWRVVSAVRGAAELTDQAVAAAAVKEHNRCMAFHKGPGAGYKGCIEATKAYSALVNWRLYGKPTINSALIATVATLTIYENAKGKKPKWLEVLKPAVCALSKVLKQWADLLGPSKGAVMAAVAAAGVFTCD